MNFYDYGMQLKSILVKKKKITKKNRHALLHCMNKLGQIRQTFQIYIL